MRGERVRPPGTVEEAGVVTAKAVGRVKGGSEYGSGEGEGRKG